VIENLMDANIMHRIDFRRIVRQSVIAWIIVNMWCLPVIYAGEVISLSGVTESVNDVTLSLDVSGIISKIYYKEGELVQKRKYILELNSKVERLEVQRRKVIWESKAEVNAASARIKTLKSQLESTRTLFNTTHSVSKEELEKMELEYVLAVEELKRLEVAEKRERIEYEMAVANLGKRRLLAPIQGTIIELFLDVGESCEANQELVHMVDTSRCLLVCNVEEQIGRNLKKGKSVDLEFRAGSEAIAKKGKIIFVSPIVDSASSLMKVKTEFDNHDGTVRPGVSGNMLLTVP